MSPPVGYWVRVKEIVLLAALASCARTVPPTPVGSQADAPVVSGEPLVRTAASQGVASLQLAALLEEHWQATMERYPTWATSLGDRRFDAHLFDAGAAARVGWRSHTQAWLQRARNIPDGDLKPSDRVTRLILVEQLETEHAMDACRDEHWTVSPRNNPLGTLNWLSDLHSIETAQDGANLVARYHAFGPLVDQQIANLRVGLVDGLAVSKASADKVIDMLDRQLEEPLTDWPAMAPATAPEVWPEAERTAHHTAVEDAVVASVRPAVQRFRAFIHDEVLPKGREGSAIGLGSLPGGESCYQAKIASHLGLDRTPATLHQTGLDELERIHAEFRVLGKRALGTDDLAEIFERLRTDPALYFSTREEVEAAASDILARAQEAVPDWFSTVPATPCVVEPIPDFEAPYTTIAYYRQPAGDGSRPGTYFINSWAPETRPRHEAAVLAVHESVPGHHFQIALAQELGELPEMRRHTEFTVFVEGWALYTERLSDEMGLYDDDLDRLGMLSFDAWRASRLVVDTGLHDQRWSRQRAETFLEENTPLAKNNIANEVDRYINTPGQALAYKTGQLEILRMRAEAEAALGQRFDIKGFHEAVLLGGALPIGLLQARVDAWIAELGDPPSTPGTP